jgi:hypothetical protein
VISPGLRLSANPAGPAFGLPRLIRRGSRYTESVEAYSATGGG